MFSKINPNKCKMKNIFIQKLSNLAFSNGLIEKHPKTKGMKNMRKK
jgi:hypothetical protein